ncbi:hypothetical protein BJ973_002083 [Actinoplanes tereljensis]|nr:DUF6082 family protein [Actinoplanes tereljensis]
MSSHLLGGTLRAALSFAAVGLLAVAILVSPAVLRFIDSDGLDWNRLGDIGQAYGPVSALLSALALCVAIFVQRRQLHQDRVLMVRSMHTNVLHTAMEEPAYGQCWGASVATEQIDDRLFIYTNMIINYWLYAWECRDISDNALRVYVRSMAASEISRAYWVLHGDWRLRSARGRQRRFLSILDEEFRAAMAAGPPARPAEPFRAPESVACCGHRRPSRHSGRFPDRTARRNSRH